MKVGQAASPVLNEPAKRGVAASFFARLLQTTDTNDLHPIFHRRQLQTPFPLGAATSSFTHQHFERFRQR